MKIKKWLVAVGVAAMFSGTLLVGIPATSALAAGGPPAISQTGQVTQGVSCGLQMGRVFGNMMDTVAQFLGISQAELVTARQSGKSMVQIADEKGVSEQQLVDIVVEQRSSQLDQLVNDGEITQDQAELNKQFIAERAKTNLNRTDVGPNRPAAAGNQAIKGTAGANQGANMGKCLGRSADTGKANLGKGLGRGADSGKGFGRGAGMGAGQGRGAGYGPGTGICTYTAR